MHEGPRCILAKVARLTDISAIDKGSPKKNFFRRFTPWVPWAKRAVLVDDEGCRIDKYGGVYLFANFARGPKSKPADHLDPAIFYVGGGESIWTALARARCLHLRARSVAFNGSRGRSRRVVLG
jgi:hypothetical protein